MHHLLILVTALLPLLASPSLADDGFKPLFDGKTLEGWVGDPQLWSVQDGVILGSTENKKLEKNSFLATEKSYKNFILKIKFKLRNHNSGVQFRSELLDDFVVRGYQADIADNQYLGILYSEKTGRGILAQVDGEEVKKHYKADDWNEYVITADGPHITQKLNGLTTVDYTEKEPEKGASEGIIALQIHVGPKMQIRFKDIQIKELP